MFGFWSELFGHGPDSPLGILFNLLPVLVTVFLFSLLPVFVCVFLLRFDLRPVLEPRFSVWFVSESVLVPAFLK